MKGGTPTNRNRIEWWIECAIVDFRKVVHCLGGGGGGGGGGVLHKAPTSTERDNRQFHYYFDILIILDSKLSWNDHIQLVTRKVSRSMGILYRVNNILNQKSLFTLYC